MIGLLATRNSMPKLNLPVSDYTAYTVKAGKDGYEIDYRANAPLVMGTRENIKKKAGFLGLGNNTLIRERQYTMEGAYHLGGTTTQGGSPEKKNVACIKAVGGGEQSGRLVGASVGAAVAPSLASVPFVGWVLAGAATMMGMEQGAEIGGNMVEDLNPNCEEEDAI